MVQHTHLYAGTRASRYSFRETDDYSMCGEDSLVATFSENIEHVTCPSCSSKWAMGEIAKLDRKITLEKADDCRGHRSVYRVMVDGVHFAQVAIDTGKHAKWHLVDHDFNRPSTTKETASGRSYNTPIILGRKSKEHAALDILSHMGHFKPYDDYIAAIKESNRQYRLRVEERQREREKEKEDRLSAIVGLAEMLSERSDLTEYERKTLMIAQQALHSIDEIEG